MSLLTGMSFQRQAPDTVLWLPESDITAHELAVASPVLILLTLRPMNQNSGSVVGLIHALPENVQRHFRITPGRVAT